jgi:hypothetical protein
LSPIIALLLFNEDIIGELKIKTGSRLYSELSEEMERHEQNEYRKKPKANFIVTQEDKYESDVIVGRDGRKI